MKRKPLRRSIFPYIQGAGEMKINSETLLEGDKVVLVPYRKDHVPRYHEWMQSSELLELTASEPLTLEQEYEMQQSWLNDHNKCTFIILDRRKWMQGEMTQSEIDCMAGDVNLFFNDPNQEVAEIEVMIAEPTCRRCGLGREALLIMMNYGIRELGLLKFVAKIGCKNEASFLLFKQLGFIEVSVSEVFNEVTMHLSVSNNIQEQLAQNTCHVRVHRYPYKSNPR